MKPKRTVRQRARTSAEVEQDRALRAKYQSQRPSLENLVASGDYTDPIPQGEYLTLMGFAVAVRSIRNQMNLSLTDLAELSGIDKAALSRLESGQVENPTYATLERIAKSLHKRLRLVLEDESVAAS